MSLLNGNFITFGGEPVTGRAPTQLFIDGPPLTREQYSAVAHAYKLFSDAVNVSVGGYSVENRTLQDGTTVRMEHTLAGDRVFVRPANAPPLLQLESLFFAVPMDLGSANTPADPNFSSRWKFRGKTAAPTSLFPARVITDASGIKQHPGNLTWWSDSIKTNRKPLIVSWYGKATRYGRMDYYGFGTPTSSVTDAIYGPSGSAARTNWSDAFKARVWTNGIQHKVQKIVAGSPVDVKVISAGLKKDGTGLYLYVVAPDSPLAVFKGKVDPYSNAPVTVTHQFDIDFTVDPASAPPVWEALLQPLYFNASCTKCAGLVAAERSSAVNTTAGAVLAAAGGPSYGVLFTEVDLAGMTTSFSTAHLTDSTVVSVTSTGADVDWMGYSTGSPPPDGTTFSGGGTNSIDKVVKRQRYGGVDYKGDVLCIAVVESILHSVVADGGDYTYTSNNWQHDNPTPVTTGYLEKTSTKSVGGGYRVFRYSDGFEYANLLDSPVVVDTLYLESTYGGASDGTYSMDLSDPIILRASLEGGDLRNDAAVVLEVTETGSSLVTATIAPASPDAVMNWGPDVFFPHTGNPGWQPSTNVTFSAHSRGRQPNLRLRVFKAGIQLEAGPLRPDAHNTGNISSATLFRQMADQSVVSLDPSNIFWGLVSSSSTSNATTDEIEGWGSFETQGSLYWLAPLATVGTPYVNTLAVTPDGTYLFYNIAAGAITGGYPAVGYDPKAAFVIDGTKYPPDTSVYMPTLSPQDPVLASPIFLDNVPTS